MPARAAIVVLCLLVASPFVSAAPKNTGAPPEWARNGERRLRSSDARAAAVLHDGLNRSYTLRTLAAKVESANVVVYVGMHPNMKPEQAGGVTILGSAGEFRYLRVSLNTSLGHDMLVITLAHELQHILEVIEHPEVRDDATLLALYRRIGYPSRILREGWETLRALDVGTEVRKELAANDVITTVAAARR